MTGKEEGVWRLEQEKKKESAYWGKKRGMGQESETRKEEGIWRLEQEKKKESACRLGKRKEDGVLRMG